MMPGPSEESCDTCYFYRNTTRSRWGVCHRYPPTVTDSAKTADQANDYGNSKWVRIKPISWCGEWKQIITENITETLKEWVKEPNENSS